MLRIAIIPAVLILAATACPTVCRANADDFANKLDLSSLRVIAVQHDQVTQTLDTYARQVLYTITGRSTLDGRQPVFTLLDMTSRPSLYADRNIIKIENLPLRMEFRLLKSIDSAEQERIVKEGVVSLNFMKRDDVRDLLGQAQAESIVKSRAVGQLWEARLTMLAVCEGQNPDVNSPTAVSDEHAFLAAAILPPLPGADSSTWRRIGEVAIDAQLFQDYNNANPTLMAHTLNAWAQLLGGWVQQNPDTVNQASRDLAAALPQWNPVIYPSLTKRKAEVIYNGLLRLTIPGAALYFLAVVLFLVSTYSGVHRLRRYALTCMIAALAVHTTGILIRWWLVGSVFPPIKNEFESVMFSAWFGAVVGLILELRKGGMFGAAASFVGTLALVAIFAAPYVTGTQIGGEIAPVSGVLMSYWLYIHVTMVTAAYSLIGMGFALSTWWLIQYYFGAARDPEGIPLSSGSSAETLTAVAAPSREALLVTLDKCNIVVLQLAFWVLGTGIVLGAIWADQSWGRPWGWDPKETFALVTWIVYLITVHARIAAKENKAWWTAVLGFTGFWVMLFNWVGVNFFLVGLHSYA